MKIEIESKRTQDGAEYYEWNLIDGPDGIDHARGYATDLIVAFSKLIEWRERIAADYTQDTENQSNETDR